MRARGVALIHGAGYRERWVPCEVIGRPRVRRLDARLIAGSAQLHREHVVWVVQRVRVDGEGEPRFVDASRVRRTCPACGVTSAARIVYGRAAPWCQCDEAMEPLVGAATC